MNWLDYTMLGLIGISALVGLARGLIREALSLVVWILALTVAWVLHREVADLLTTQITEPSARLGVAFVGLILGTLLIGAILGAILTALIHKAGLSALDRLFGLLFGGARGVLIVAMAVFLASLTPLPAESWWRQSRLIEEFQSVANWLLERTPEELQAQLRRL